MRWNRFSVLAAALFVGCTASEPAQPGVPAEPQLVPLNLPTCRSLLRDDESFESLQQAALRTVPYFEEAGAGTASFFGKQVSRGELATIAATAANAIDAESVANLICDRFKVYRVETATPLGVATYSELELRARRTPDTEFRYPVYGPPSDLVEVDLSRFCPTCEHRVAQGRVVGSRVVPYATRTEIEAGALEGQDYELGYLADPVDAFALRLRGTGTLVFDDGTRMYLAYASANGQPRADVGDQLIKQGKLTRDQATLHGIREYLRGQPLEVSAVLRSDEHYAFYGLVPVGPSGSLGVPITPGRTLAADSRVYPRGAMGFVRVPGKASRFVFLQDSEVGMQGADRLGLFVGSDAVPQSAQAGEFYLVLPY